MNLKLPHSNLIQHAQFGDKSIQTRPEADEAISAGHV